MMEKISAGEASPVSQDKPVFNPMAMVDRPGFIVRFLGRVFFHRVKFDERWIEKVKSLDKEGSVVYVMNRVSLLDYLYFQWAFLRVGLPLATFANGLRLVHAFAFHPLWEMVLFLFRWMFRRVRVSRDLDEVLSNTVEGGRAALLFLKPTRGLVQWGAKPDDGPIRKLISLQRTNNTPIFLVPQFLFWNRQPEKYQKSIIDIVFGNPDAPGRLRKIINFVLNHRRAFVHVGDPINLREFIAQEEDQLDNDGLVRKLRWRLNHQFLVESKVVTGPLLKNSRRIRSEILRNEDFKEAVESLAVELGQSPESVTKRSARYLKEIAADFRIWAVELIFMVLTVIWNRLYEGFEFDDDGLSRIRDVAKKAPIVVVPMHRSHIDYLVVSYLFYGRGLITPHIVAGNNLAFFPVGQLFRRAGGFFIRRSFWNNRVYALAFKFYIRKLVKEGYWIEFFPEGGRSRTGKSLPPRMGIIRELVECVEAGVSEDLYFCPMSICYEKILEGKEYGRELSGQEKESESVGAVLRASRVLVSKYGKVYVNFSEPVSVREFMERYRREHGQTQNEEMDKRALKSFAYTLMAGMNDSVVVTPSSLLATVLLAHPRKGISRSQLVRRMGFLMLYFERKGAVFSETLQGVWEQRKEQMEALPASADLERAAPGNLAYGTDLYRTRLLASALDEILDDALTLFVKDGWIEMLNYGDESVYTVPSKERVKLDFYKNNTLHLLTHDALLATALLSARGGDSIVYEDLRATCFTLSQLFKREFIFRPGDTFDGQFFEALGRFIEAGWVSENDDGTFAVNEDADELVVFFANSIQPYVEGYWLTITHICDLLGSSRPEKDWIKSLHRRARALVAAEKLQFSEAVSQQIFTNAVRAMSDIGLVTRKKLEVGHQTGRKARSVYMLEVEETQISSLKELLPRLDDARSLL